MIPTHNRPEQLRETLDAVEGLRAPPGGYEILVIDDGGDVNLAFLSQYASVRQRRQPNAGPAAARNSGARFARGRSLAFTDDDCRPADDWLLKLDAAIEAHPDVLIGGHTINALTDNPYSAASQDLVDYLYEVENRDPTHASFFASNNIAATREAFLEVGGFDQTYPLAAGEDRAFCDAWRQAQRRMVYVPQAIIHHHHRLDLRSFWRQHVRYGRGAYRFHTESDGTIGGENPAKGNRIAFTIKLITYSYRSEFGSLRLPRLFLLALSQAATTLGYAKQEWADRKTLGLLP